MFKSERKNLIETDKKVKYIINIIEEKCRI